MVLDKINNVFGSHIISKKTVVNNSYRTVLYKYVQNHFWENYGINIIFGSKVDNPATKLFLPVELLQNIKISKYLGKPIAQEETVLNKKTIAAAYFSFSNSIYPYCIFFVLILLINKKIIYLLYFSILGLAGIFFSLIGFYSFHQEISNNYNVLIFNPSLLILIYFTTSKNQKWIKNLCYFNITCLGIYVIILSNKAHLLIMLPMIICSLIIFYRFMINKKLLTTIK